MLLPCNLVCSRLISVVTEALQLTLILANAYIPCPTVFASGLVSSLRMPENTGPGAGSEVECRMADV